MIAFCVARETNIAYRASINMKGYCEKIKYPISVSLYL